MEEQQIGWIAAIIIGGIAGWLAEQFMKSQVGLVMNIVLGIIGAAVASWLFGFLGISFGGWIGYLIAGFIGACILIAIVRAFSGGLQQRTGKPCAASGHAAAPQMGAMTSRLLVCRERSILRGDGGSVMTVSPSRPEARIRFGSYTANEAARRFQVLDRLCCRQRRMCF